MDLQKKKQIARRKEREVLDLLRRYTLQNRREVAECAIRKNIDDGSSTMMAQTSSHMTSVSVSKLRFTEFQDDKESIQQISRTKGLRLGASTEQIKKIDTVESITPLCSQMKPMLIHGVDMIGAVVQTALKEDSTVTSDMEYRAENRKVVGSAKKYEGFIPKLHVQSLLQSGADDQNEHKVWCYDLTTDYIESCDEETYRTNVRKSKPRNVGLSMVMISQRKRALIKKRRRARVNTAIIKLGCIFAVVVCTVSSYL